MTINHSDIDKELKFLRERMRHSAAHIMADAVLKLFPNAKLAIGPPTEDGFYYDFQLEKPFTPDDLDDIRKYIKEVLENNNTFNNIIDAIHSYTSLSQDVSSLRKLLGTPDLKNFMLKTQYSIKVNPLTQ